MSIDRSSSTGRSRGSLFAFALLIIVAGVAIAIALRAWGGSVAPAAVLQLSLLPPAELRSGAGDDDPFGLALSPDGHRIAFPATRNGITQLWLRDLSRDDVQPLPGTEPGIQPFWSPDGSSLGFFAAGKMRVFVFADAGVRDLADAPSPRGAVWHPGGDIVYAPANEGGLMVRRANGRVEAFSTVERGAEVSHRHPRLMGDGHDVLFFVQATVPTREGIWIAPFEQPADPQAARQERRGGGQRRRRGDLLERGRSCRAAPESRHSHAHRAACAARHCRGPRSATSALRDDGWRRPDLRGGNVGTPRAALGGSHRHRRGDPRGADGRP